MSRIANQPLTKANDPHRFTDLAQVLAAMILLVLPAFFYAAQRSSKLEADRRVGALERELLAIEDEREIIQLQLERLREPRSLAERAASIAGLAPPEDGQLVVLDAPGPGNGVLLASRSSDGHR